jgi:predicted nucleic acid-binding protein
MARCRLEKSGMPAKAFLDTNVIVYALSYADPAKKARARLLLTDLEATISTQVLMEATHVMIRKMKVKPTEAAMLLRGVMARPVIQQSTESVEEAWRIAGRYQMGIYDASIVAAAIMARCTVLYSEDFQASQKIESLVIQNPFA